MTTQPEIKQQQWNPNESIHSRIHSDFEYKTPNKNQFKTKIKKFCAALIPFGPTNI